MSTPKPFTPDDEELADKITVATTANSNQPDPPAVPNLDEIRQAVGLQLHAAREQLAALRKDRDQLNGRIKKQVAVVDELERVVNQLKPRPPKKRAAR